MAARLLRTSILAPITGEHQLTMNAKLRAYRLFLYIVQSAIDARLDVVEGESLREIHSMCGHSTIKIPRACSK
jgi:hypothetical protein